MSRQTIISSEALAPLLLAIQHHPSVKLAGQVPLPSGETELELRVHVELPSRSKQTGQSLTGVREVEPVWLLLPRTFPFRAPAAYLRKDFCRRLPHINPGRSDERVKPCLFAGDPDEIWQQDSGPNTYLDQLVVWLSRAAANRLMDLAQGWEPIRRDVLLDWITCDLGQVRGLVERYAGAYLIKTFFVQFSHGNGRRLFSALQVEQRQKSLRNSGRYATPSREACGITNTLLTWSNEEDEGQPQYCREYCPETVATVSELVNVARTYGCNAFGLKLEQVLDGLGQSLSAKSSEWFPLMVILCARRPVHLINETSNLELIPYVVDVKPGKPLNPDWPVRPLGHRDSICADLLQRMSFGRAGTVSGTILQLGCGSLGSKIAMHLARAGLGPFVLVDNKILSPHNMARHAIVGNELDMWLAKSTVLQQAIQRLGGQAQARVEDIVELAAKLPPDKLLSHGKTRLVIDSTAALCVREALCSLSPNAVSGRLVNTTLYADGRMGIILTEGQGRNPRVDDLVVSLYDQCIDTSHLRAQLNPDSNALSQVPLGQGCSSSTMAIPDSRISMFASAMAERIQQMLAGGFSEEGDVWTGLVGEDGITVSWQRSTVGHVTVLDVDNKTGWTVRLLPSAVATMQAEAKLWGSTETGGMLLGRVFPLRRCIIVSRVLAPPADSRRGPFNFTLGFEGATERINAAQAASANTLHYLGTWHSHPLGGSGSSTDYSTLRTLTKQRDGVPAVMVIWTPNGFRAMVS